MQNDTEKFKKEFKNRLYGFTLRLIELIDRLPKDTVTLRLADQLLKSGTNIISNFVESQTTSGKKQSTIKFSQSLRSINESKLWLALLRDSNRLKKVDIKWFLNELEEFSNIFSSDMISLNIKK